MENLDSNMHYPGCGCRPMPYPDMGHMPAMPMPLYPDMGHVPAMPMPDMGYMPPMNGMPGMPGCYPALPITCPSMPVPLPMPMPAPYPTMPIIEEPHHSENHMKQMYYTNMYLAAMYKAEAYRHKMMYYSHNQNDRDC